MISWMSVWSFLLIVVLLTFSIVTIYVAIGGARDIRSMLREIDKRK